PWFLHGLPGHGSGERILPHALPVGGAASFSGVVGPITTRPLGARRLGSAARHQAGLARPTGHSRVEHLFSFRSPCPCYA
ncbi:MAG: hypothetical protein ACK559_13445, partial [bacterium]